MPLIVRFSVPPKGSLSRTRSDLTTSAGVTMKRVTVAPPGDTSRAPEPYHGAPRKHLADCPDEEKPARRKTLGHARQPLGLDTNMCVLCWTDQIRQQTRFLGVRKDRTKHPKRVICFNAVQASTSDAYDTCQPVHSGHLTDLPAW